MIKLKRRREREKVIFIPRHSLAQKHGKIYFRSEYLVKAKASARGEEKKRICKFPPTGGWLATVAAEARRRSGKKSLERRQREKKKKNNADRRALMILLHNSFLLSNRREISYYGIGELQFLTYVYATKEDRFYLKI